MQPDKSERLAVGSERYGSVQNDGGCASCGHSFYQHSQGYDNKWHCKPGCKCDGFYLANARPFRCTCGGTIEKIGDDEYECDDCGALFETDDWRSDRLKAKNSKSRKNAGRGVGPVCANCESGRHGGCGSECECTCAGTKLV